MRKDLGARAFGFGWPVPVLMVATYNDDGSVNVMNLHEAMRRNAGDLALCIGPRSKTHENVEKRGAFTVALVNREMMAEIDYLGTVTGKRVPDKFARTGLKAVRSMDVTAEAFILHVETEEEEIRAKIQKMAQKIQTTLDYCRQVVRERTPYVITQQVVRTEM